MPFDFMHILRRYIDPVDEDAFAETMNLNVKLPDRLILTT